ncbi:MAG: helix-turn-helix domain-containing protein [Candidatus Heimdallarchaeota archaeon]|nr:helix-turn-helix domain-containing protein [Candidatus Heimdallarchaeota archaeon]
MTKLKVDQILEILSNQYRREILRLLTESDRYAFELAKLLDISQRAVKNHLNFLEELGLINSEKRKSSKGPAREYFVLDKAVIFSLTIAPNLFLAAIRPLSEEVGHIPINPSLQLNPPKSESDTKAGDVIKEGMLLLPQIREGLDMLQAEQSKLLRGYQGLQSHISEQLLEEGYSIREIRLILHLLENEGELTPEDIKFTFGDILSISDCISSLKSKDVIYTKVTDSEDDINITIYLNEDI